MKAHATGIVLAATACAALAAAGTAAASPPSIVIGADGETAPVFSYGGAIRERVFIPVAGVDQDGDTVTDRVAVDIIRPAESDAGLSVPAIIDPSPYLTSLGRGNESEFIHTTVAGVLDRFPLFYDNFFVPRGYAVLLAQAVGTAFSTGCPLHGGPGDVAGFKAVIDWLQGRVQGFDKDGNAMVASWHNGKAAMIGKSYDGTFANGVAATGVDGLTTIVPISAISDWYDYSRMGGIRFNTHYPASLSNTITGTASASLLGVVPPSRQALCAATRTAMSLVDGDATGDVNDFWEARDYNKDVASVHAAVFASHGINDDNVRPNHVSQWWDGLAANNAPRKLWLSLEGHVDPFDYRRGEWVDTLHRWFDYWLQGVPNGIMAEPQVDIETSKDTWSTAADWPLPGTAPVDVFLQGTAMGSAGLLALSSGGIPDTLSFSDLSNQSENTMINNPTGPQANRLVFLSPVLTHDLHLSGTPKVDIQVSLSKTQSNMGAVLVDYGAGTHVTRSGDGISTTTTETCWGEATAVDDACYREVTKPTVNVTSWRVSKGILDSSNRDSLVDATPAAIGTTYEFRWPTLPTDYVFPAGHQIGVILVANYQGFSSVNGTTATQFTVDTKLSKVVLPVVGGTAAALEAGLADTDPPVLHVPDPITVGAASPAGTAVTFAATATDLIDPSPVVSCAPASGSVFPIGTTTVHCTATDSSGNAANGSFTVNVTSPAEALVTLLGHITGVGPGLSLAQKVAAIQASVAAGKTNAACGAVNAFVNAVNAQSGKTLTKAQADALIAEATAIAAGLGC